MDLQNWNLTPREAVQMQRELRDRVHLEPLKSKPRLIAGADVSFNKYSPTIYAGFVVLDALTLKIVDRASAILDVTFPYIPGLLSFRECPPLLAAWNNLKTKPDLVVFDGQGIAHPRRLGIASHMGLILNLPTIGCAKSVLVGSYHEPSYKAGSMTPLNHGHERIGTVLRTKDKVKPVFISPGHLIDFDSSVEIILSCRGGYRIPEPTRQAHLFVNELRRNDQKPVNPSELVESP